MRYIKEVIVTVNEAGLTVVASVCDGGSSNQAAINTLIGDTEKIKGKDYVHICECSFSKSNRKFGMVLTIMELFEGLRTSLLKSYKFLLPVRVFAFFL